MLDLTTFAATCHITAMTSDDASAIHSALLATTGRIVAAGGRVRFLRSGFLPDTHQWFGVFVAQNPDAVERIVHIAQLSPVTIHRLVEFVAQAGDGQAADAVQRS